jgi:hypothetical protein
MLGKVGRILRSVNIIRIKDRNFSKIIIVNKKCLSLYNIFKKDDNYNYKN